MWRPGSGGERFDVVDPSDLTVVARFAAATEEDCTAAVDAAAAAQESWAATPPRVRGELLRSAYEVLTAEVEQFAEIIVRENGKSWADAVGEADYAKEFFRWFAEEAVRIPGEFRLSPAGDKRIVVDRQPIGVALLISGGALRRGTAVDDVLGRCAEHRNRTLVVSVHSVGWEKNVGCVRYGNVGWGRCR